ncbi:hypothetical protein B7T09_21515 [Cronobacter sakazakii]|nr:hypothetical protein B7T09_21515 [Cronobacter sakazakii]
MLFVLLISIAIILLSSPITLILLVRTCVPFATISMLREKVNGHPTRITNLHVVEIVRSLLACLIMYLVVHQ